MKFNSREHVEKYLVNKYPGFYWDITELDNGSMIVFNQYKDYNSFFNMINPQPLRKFSFYPKIGVLKSGV